MSTYWNIDKLISESSHYWRSFTIQSAVELDLFTELDGNNLTASEVACAINGDREGVEILLNALAALQLVIKEGDLFSGTEFSNTYLSSNSPSYAGHIIKHHKNLAQSWLDIDQNILGETVARDNDPFESRESFLMGMFNLGSRLSPKLLECVDLSQKNHLLDLGGGPGGYAVGFCNKFQNLKVTLFDLPDTEHYANRIIENFGLEDRISFISGDFLCDELPLGHDVAWLSHIIHGLNPESAQKVIKRTVDSLPPGGEIYLHEFILNEDECSPLFAALFSINMYLGGKGGRSYTESALRSYLEESGIVNIELIELGSSVASRVLRGRKPE